MMNPDTFKKSFDAGRAYAEYIRTGQAHQQEAWIQVHTRVQVTPPQAEVLQGFTRRLNVLVLSGMWCGDCAQQCPIFDHFARTATTMDLRFVDRDEHRDLSDMVKIAGGNRVPTVLFANEDFEFCGLSGDKSLSRLRAQAAKALGAACPVPGAPIGADELAAGVQDWLNDFERAHLLVRLSPKLRQRHGD